MAVTEASVFETEIEHVDKKVPLLFERDDVFYSFIEKRNVEVISSQDMRIPLEIRPGSAFGYWNPDGGDMGRGNGPLYKNATIGARHFILRVEWTYQSQISTDDARKAVINNFKRLLSKSMAEFRAQIDRQCMTDSTATLVSNTTVSIGTGTGGADVWTVAATDGFGVRLVRPGQPVGIYNAALTVKRGEVTVQTVDYANRTMQTLPSTATAVSGDLIVASGLSTSPVGLLGVPYHYDSTASGFWLGFDRSTTPEILANRVNAGGALALPFARLAMNKIGDRVGINERNHCTAWMHPCQKQAYEEIGQLVSIIQKQPREEALDMYFGDNMQLAGCPIKENFNWDKTRIDFINPEIWGRAELNSAKFYETGGVKIFPLRGASGGLAASSIFYLVVDFNLFIDCPPKASYIDGLSIPSGY